MSAAKQLPVVLLFGGLDPTAGAGLAADILTVASLGGHPAPVACALTAQDTVGVKEFQPIDSDWIEAQARAVLEDMPVAAIKTGMLGSHSNVAAVAAILEDYPEIPLIVDPVLASGRGDSLSEGPYEDALVTLLLPLATVATPNSLEARRLAPDADTLEACAQRLLATGCHYVLVTGAHESGAHVVNRLFGNRRLLESYTWERLPGEYHGSGCTLAAACAATLAQGLDPVQALGEAQDYAWNTLAHALRLGMGQQLPDRHYWARHDDDEAH